MRKIAEGELLIHTQKSGQNVDQLRQYLASLRAESNKTGASIDQLAKSIFLANARGASLGKVVKGLASAAGFGGFGAAAYLAIDKLSSGIVNAQEESDKLTESLNKAVGAPAADSIEGSIQKMQSLTSAINEAKGAIGKQGIMNSIAAFFFNDDADKASKAFEKAVEARIALGDKLTAQEAERIVQQKILMDLEGDMAEVYKINIETRKKLSQIEANETLTAQQKIDQAKLATEEQADKLRSLRTKKDREEAKKSADERKRVDEEFARTTLKISDSLAKQEEEIFKKNAEEFKNAQEERAKAAEEANKRIAESSKRAIDLIQKQDDAARKKSEEAKGIDEAILGSSKAGKQSLDVARKQRARQISKEDYRTQEAFLQSEATRLSQAEGKTVTMQDVRNRMASRVAAGEAPSLAEKLQGTAAGIEPAQVARSRAESAMKTQGKEAPDLLKSIEELLKKLSSAPLVTSGT